MTEDTLAIRAVASSGVSFRVVRTRTADQRRGERGPAGHRDRQLIDLDPADLVRLLDADVAGVTRPAS